MAQSEPALTGLDGNAALRAIFEGTAATTGEQFFAALVQNLAKALGTLGAWVTEYLEDQRRLRALAFWLGDDWLPEWEGDIDGTPCQDVIENAQLIHCVDNVSDLYEGDPELRSLGAVSYMGVPLFDVDGRVMGHLAVLDTRPMPAEPETLALFNIFAARATAEVRRLRAEAAVREREQQLTRLVDSALDAIVQLDRNLRIVLINPAGERIFSCCAETVRGESLERLLTTGSYQRVLQILEHFREHPDGEMYAWIPSGLQAVGCDGRGFPAEATLSVCDLQHCTYYTLILRNVNEKLEAEARLQALAAEAEYLREELSLLQGTGAILGKSTALLRTLDDVARVAPTDATVLIHGETGTGKELIARAVHEASARAGKPLVKVNCAAISPTLMESEFFGHEKGAFTGATSRREGRFTLADGGSIFLDEIGELPIDLQAKLLRVLQEGEFEPVGSSSTHTVNVRVLAATNRDLFQAVQDGRFREDLYYRLSVFPIEVPPLRERLDDIPLLAETFMQRCALRSGKRIEPLTEEDRLRLTSYDWPGNVRELQNVIERAVITAVGGRLNLDRAFPGASSSGMAATTPVVAPLARVLTETEMQEVERENLLRALSLSGWRVSGEGGAAQRLGMNASTLSSRMKALGIKRPSRA